MASYKAIAAVSDALVYLLESQFSPADFDANLLEFEVYTAKDFSTPMNAGVSLFLYRVYPNVNNRTPPGRLQSNGQRQQPMLPVDLHFLLTAWAQEASLQHLIAAWMMRTLEDTPSLPAGLLNHRYANTFHADETVEVHLTELATEELFEIWEVIANNAYQISVPYVARNVKIESLQTRSQGAPVQERVLDYQSLVNS